MPEGYDRVAAMEIALKDVWRTSTPEQLAQRSVPRADPGKNHNDNTCGCCCTFFLPDEE